MFLNGCAFLHFPYSTVVVFMVTTRRRQNSTHVFNLLKDEYHLELIIYCICLYVGGGMFCYGSKMPKNSFFFQIWLPHPPLVTRYDLTKNHIVFDLYLNYSFFNHNVSAYKDKNQYRCVIGYMKVQKLSIFTDFFVIFSPNSSSLVTMATGNKLGERNMD